MKFTRTFALAAAACLMAAAAVVHDVGHAIVHVVRASWKWVVERVEPVLAKLTAEPEQARPRVVLVAAKAFVLRMAKRERPVIAPRWRMCPST